MRFCGGHDIKIVGMSPGMGTGMQFTYISINKDRQFVERETLPTIQQESKLPGERI